MIAFEKLSEGRIRLVPQSPLLGTILDEVLHEEYNLTSDNKAATDYGNMFVDSQQQVVAKIPRDSGDVILERNEVDILGTVLYRTGTLGIQNENAALRKLIASMQEELTGQKMLPDILFVQEVSNLFRGIGITLKAQTLMWDKEL